MAKTSLSSKEFNRIQANIVKELVGFQWQHEAGENNRLRISRGNTLNRISRIVEKVAEVGDARQILALERHCEQSYLAFFANTADRRQGSIRALQTISRLGDTLTLPLDPERYKQNLALSVGAHNMDKVPAVPEDEFHIFVRSQSQRLSRAVGQFATPPEEWYFRARSAALKAALKSHERECANALGLESAQQEEQELER